MTWQTVTAQSPSGQVMDFIWRDKAAARADARLWRKYGAIVVRPGLALHGNEIEAIDGNDSTPIKDVIVTFVDGRKAPLHLLGEARRIKGQLCLVEPGGAE